MFQIPALSDLVERARSAFRANLPGSDAWLWPNNLNPTAKVIGGATYEVFGFADYIQRQKFAGTADSENLELHGQEYGIARRPATSAGGVVPVTVLDAYTVESGAIFRRLDGVEYVALTGASRGSAGVLNITVAALVDGANGNANSGTSLEIVSGTTDTNGDAEATAEVGDDGIVGGLDIEPDGEYWTTDLGTFRGRILFRKRNPPNGGSASDYVLWASDVSGVTRVFVERLWNGSGTVRVFPLMDNLYSDGIASVGDIARVTAFLETMRPAGADMTVAAPTAVPVDITITGLTPNTTAVKEAVLAELRDAFRRLSVVAGNDTPHDGMPFLAVPASFSRSWIWQAIANASGEQRHIVTTPSADVSLSAGHIATLGNVTFA